MQIQILNVTIETKPTAKGTTYQKAAVAYKNLTFQGKVEGKDVMSFGVTADSFKTLSLAQPGELYDVDVVKNAAGYNDWVKVAKAAAGAAPSPVAQPAAGTKPAPAFPSPKNTYETPEERARKQVYIVRQSSISGAIATLSVGAKKLEPADVIALAERYTDFVFGKTAPQGGATGFDDVPDFDETFQNPEVK